MHKRIVNGLSPPFKQRVTEVGRIAVPVIGANIARNLLLLVDTAMVGKYSTRSLAAVGIATSIFQVFLLIGNSFAVGAHTSLAHYFGARNSRKISLSAVSGMVLSVAAAAMMVLLCTVIRDPAFGFMNLDAALRRETAAYYDIMKFSFLLLLPAAMMKSMFSVRMQTRTIFVSSIIMCVVNCLGDYVLIYGAWGFPRLGVKGAATASLIAGACALANYGLHLPWRRRISSVLLMFRAPREMAVEIRRIALLALPTTFEWSSWILGAFFVNRFVVPYGTAAVALFHICLKLQTLFVLPSAGLNQAGITLVGRAYGAGELGHIPAWKQTILKLGIAGGMVGLLVLLIIPRPILSVFIGVEGLAAMRQIRLATAISGVLVIAKITNIIMGSVLRSMGYIRYFVVLSTLSCVVTVSLGYTFTSWLHLGVAGAFAAMLSDELLRNAVHFVRFEWFVRISGIKHRAHERTRPTPAGSRA